MSDIETACLLKAVLDEVCADIPEAETATRLRVATRIVEITRNARWSIDDLRRAGRDALNRAPTMWR